MILKVLMVVCQVQKLSQKEGQNGVLMKTSYPKFAQANIQLIWAKDIISVLSKKLAWASYGSLGPVNAFTIKPQFAQASCNSPGRTPLHSLVIFYKQPCVVEVKRNPTTLKHKRKCRRRRRRGKVEPRRYRVVTVVHFLRHLSCQSCTLCNDQLVFLKDQM